MDKATKLRRKQKRRERNGSGKILIFVVLLLVIVLVFMTNILKIEAVMVTGAVHYAPEEIKEAIGITEESNILDLYFKSKIDYERYPYIENIEIDYNDYKMIKVMVEEKKIIGYLPYMNKHLCIDKDGYIVDYTDQLDEYTAIIEGITIESFSLGEKIDVSDDIIRTGLMFFQAEQQYSFEIDKIVFNNGDLSDITIYINNIEILFGNLDDFNDKTQYLSNSLPFLTDSRSKVFDLENKVLK